MFKPSLRTHKRNARIWGIIFLLTFCVPIILEFIYGGYIACFMLLSVIPAGLWECNITYDTTHDPEINDTDENIRDRNKRWERFTNS